MCFNIVESNFSNLLLLHSQEENLKIQTIYFSSTSLHLNGTNQPLVQSCYELAKCPKWPPICYNEQTATTGTEKLRFIIN